MLYFKPCAGKIPGGRTKLKEFFRLLKFHIHRNKEVSGKKLLKTESRRFSAPANKFDEN